MATTNGGSIPDQQQRFVGSNNSSNSNNSNGLLCGSATMKPCLPTESGPPAINGLKFKIKRTSTDDGRPSNNHVATQIMTSGNGSASSSSSSANNYYPDNSKTMKNNNKTNKVSTTERGAGQLKSGLDHRNPVKTGSDSGVGSGQNSLSSSAGSSPMSPVILTANSPDMRSPGHFSTSGNGKRPEHFGSVIGHSSPSKKLKTCHEEPDEAISLPRVSNGLEKDIGTMTEPESLGPCEPGTAVKLQGIVWQETDKGLLVLNVTWKGKTFMGTLLDCQRQSEAHKWGPPRDALAARGRTRRGGRNSRSRTPPVKIPLRKGMTNSKHTPINNFFSSTPVSPMARGQGQVAPGGRYDDNMEDVTEEEMDDRCDVITIAAAAKHTLSPTSRLIECPKTECSKKYRDLDALKYHLSFAHNELQKPTLKASTTSSDENGDKTSKAKASTSTNSQVSVTNGESVKKEEVKTEIKEEVKREAKNDEPLALSLKKETTEQSSEVKKETATTTMQNGHDIKSVISNQPPFVNSVCHGVMQMLGSKVQVPPQQSGYVMNGANGQPSYINNIPSPARFSGSLPQQQQQQPQQKQQQQSQSNPRTVSPAYSDISDEEPETSAPIGLTTKHVEAKQSLINVRRDKSGQILDLPVRTPLDLTQPNFDSFPGMRPSLQQQQQFQLPPHLAQGSVRFPPPVLPTSTPSLNMLHSIMASAKLQELQQAMAAGGPMQGLRPPPSHQPVMSLPPNVPKPSLYSSKPPTSSSLPPPPPLRHEHNHTHLHLGTSYPGSGLSHSVSTSSAMASKMAQAAAEAAKRAMTPVVTSGSLQLPMHLSPYSASSFGLGPPRLASPYPPKP